MGFRDLRLFNDALLAKQFWRLHCYPTSLLARVMKARYYPSSSVWDAKVGVNSSYAWKSIRGSRSVLDLGVRWKVGDGRSIKLWKDAWLGGPGSGKLITAPRLLDKEPDVSSIIDDIHHFWRFDLSPRYSPLWTWIALGSSLLVPLTPLIHGFGQ